MLLLLLLLLLLLMVLLQELLLLLPQPFQHLELASQKLLRVHTLDLQLSGARPAAAARCRASASTIGSGSGGVCVDGGAVAAFAFPTTSTSTTSTNTVIVIAVNSIIFAGSKVGLRLRQQLFEERRCAGGYLVRRVGGRVICRSRGGREGGGGGGGSGSIFVQVQRPALADALNVKVLVERADLAPRVPVGGDEDAVAVDDVVLQRLALQQRVDAQQRVQQRRQQRLGVVRLGRVDQ
jgi:hypothetical protein